MDRPGTWPPYAALSRATTAAGCGGGAWATTTGPRLEDEPFGLAILGRAITLARLDRATFALESAPARA